MIPESYSHPLPGRQTQRHDGSSHADGCLLTADRVRVGAPGWSPHCLLETESSPWLCGVSLPGYLILIVRTGSLTTSAAPPSQTHPQSWPRSLNLRQSWQVPAPLYKGAGVPSTPLHNPLHYSFSTSRVPSCNDYWVILVLIVRLTQELIVILMALYNFQTARPKMFVCHVCP